jgi:hypothetical protein
MIIALALLALSGVEGLAQEAYTASRLEKDVYLPAVTQYKQGEELMESDPRAAIAEFDAILSNPKISAKTNKGVECILTVIERPGETSSPLLFVPYQLRGRARLALAGKARSSEPQEAEKLMAGAVEDFRESLRRGVASSEAYLRNAELEHQRMKAVAIGGGVNNRASDFYATVAGGGSNAATGWGATIAGGVGNMASGTVSFAAGTSARAEHPGAFVWADHLRLPFASTAPNQFSARVTGGARFVTAVDEAGTALTGPALPAGAGGWAAHSDRAAKRDLKPVDAKDVSERVAALPLYTWGYKGQDAAVKHMGPTAQDFRAAFGLGEDERYIGMVDADGVSLAAIQGLHLMLKERDAKISDLDKRLAALEKLLGEKK